MSSITIIIPALNESRNVAGAVETIIPYLTRLDDYEIIIFNDGSTDDTGTVCDSLAATNNKIKVVHNPKNKGMGYNYKAGVAMASKDYILMVPGDNCIEARTYDKMWQDMGTVDIILAYTANLQVRPLSRQIISKMFTGLMNFLFGMDLLYFNGIVLHKREIIQSITIQTDGFAYQAEALIRLIKKRNHSYLQVPQWIEERKIGTSKAFHISNIYRVVKTILLLFYQIQLKNS